MGISKSGSMSGYSLKVWAGRNKDNLKLLLSGVLGLIAVAVSTLSPAWSVTLGGVVVVASKLLVDGLEFYLSDVKIV